MELMKKNRQQEGERMGLRLFRERCKESVLQSGGGRPCTGGVRHPRRGLWGGAASSTKAPESEPGAAPSVSEAFFQAKPSIRIRSKKGFFFTMVAIALSMVLILSFRVYDVQERNQKDEVVTARILALNHLVKDVKEDVRKGLYITSKRALLGIQEYVAEEGAFLPNATAVMDINVMDRKGTASWQQEQEVSALVNIIDLEDPLYVVKTGGKITNIIRHTNYTPFVQGSDVTNLLLHTNDSLYIAPETTTNYRINNTPSWFKLDESRLDLYGVAGLTT